MYYTRYKRYAYKKTKNQTATVDDETNYLMKLNNYFSRSIMKIHAYSK